eukprot:g33978.t1
MTERVSCCSGYIQGVLVFRYYLSSLPSRLLGSKRYVIMTERVSCCSGYIQGALVFRELNLFDVWEQRICSGIYTKNSMSGWRCIFEYMARLASDTSCQSE